MDWSTLVSTVAGAVLGVSTTLVADRARGNRDDAFRAQELRRRVYVEFVSTLNRINESLRAVALGDHSPTSQVESAAREAFRRADAYSTRDELMITAPEFVVTAADRAFYCLRDIRDLVAGGSTVESDEYKRLFSDYIGYSRVMRNCMREDLGAETLSFDWLPW